MPNRAAKDRGLQDVGANLRDLPQKLPTIMMYSQDKTG